MKHLSGIDTAKISPSPKNHSVLVLTFSPIARGPRPLKQINRLRQDYDVTTAGFGPPPVQGVPHIELDPTPKSKGLMKIPGAYNALLLFRQHRYVTKNYPRSTDAYKRLNKQQWDIIIAHDVITMPLANKLKPRMGVLSDLHEYAPKQSEHSYIWRVTAAPYFRWLLRNEVSKAKVITTVGQGIVDEYKKEYGITSTLVVNATPYQNFVPGKVSSPIRLVHSGAASPARKLEIMINGVIQSDADVTLDLYLMPSDEKYLLQLKKLAKDEPRIRFRDPVQYSQLLKVLHSYDVGISLIAPTTFNLEWCLPNKFFDFVQTRLGIIVGPSAEMVRYVNKHGFGTVTKDFSVEAFSKTLNRLTPELVAEWKEASHNSAETLSGEKQAEIWADAVDRMASPL